MNASFGDPRRIVEALGRRMIKTETVSAFGVSRFSLKRYL
jgi:hypothetical protein